MAYPLNTSHALYGNLIELFGVQSGALVSHKTARTFTKHTDATYGTGTWGEHFNCINGGYTAKGASFTPSIDRNTVTNPALTVFIAINAIGSATGNFAVINNTSNPDLGSLSPGMTTSGHATAAFGYTKRSEGTTAIGSGIRTFCTTRAGDGATDGKIYLDGVLEASGYADGSRTNASFDFIGGCDGQGSVGLSIVWVAFFDKALSSAEILDLHNSLGASNEFGLVQSAGGTDATAPGATVTGTGTVSAGSATGGSGATGTFTFDACENNTHSGILNNVAVNWTWLGGTVGSITSITNGSGTMTTTGMAISGVPTGAGCGIIRSADGTVVAYQEGTVA